MLRETEFEAGQLTKGGTTGLGRATVRFELGWGGATQASGGKTSTLSITGRIELFRSSGGLLIDEVEERFRERVSGAEKEFWAQGEAGGMFGTMVRFYNGIVEMAQAAWRQYQAKQGQ